MLVEITLDACELAPPEPFDRATEILRQMQPGQYLRMLHRRVPYPLFDYCQPLSLAHSVIEGKEVPYEIIIYFPSDERELRREDVL